MSEITEKIKEELLNRSELIKKKQVMTFGRSIFNMW